MQKETYFHVGLGKTGTTFIQYKYFPKLKGIYYVQRTKYKKFHEIISNTNKEKYLFSREFDRQYETEVSKIAKHYPDSGIIIVLRRNDSWMASQYRRYVKNGGKVSFSEFIDLKENKGLWDQKDLYFYPKIEMAEKLFSKKPLVLIYDQLRKDPYSYFDLMADYFGATYKKEDINLRPYHTSYNEKQLKIIRNVNKVLFRTRKKEIKNKALHYIEYRSRWLLCHLILYFALLIPKAWVTKEPLIKPEELEELKSFYKEDWQKCVEYASGDMKPS